MTGGWQLGIDIGGTFTDVVAFEPATDTLGSAKAKSRSCCGGGYGAATPKSTTGNSA